MNLNNILQQFCIKSEIEPYGNGHINDTYYAHPEFIIQRINTQIFRNPEGLMENIENITSFLREKIVNEGGNPERETLTIIKSIDGKPYYKMDDNTYFRAYYFISGTKTIETDKTIEDMYQAGKGFGRFARRLSDFPVGKLHETISDFHNTPKRVEALKTAIHEDKLGRVSSCLAEIDFAIKNAEFADKITSGIADGRIPLRVTHNDTKINNILFDSLTGEAVCVIDLDTIMPGSILYDFGDALRLGASTGAEDEVNLDKVWFDIPVFEYFAKGYLEEMGNSLTDREAELLSFSPKLLTYECGIRFLIDYLNGDTYFKIHRKNHNLDRARNQFKLVADICAKEQKLQEIIKNMI